MKENILYIDCKSGASGDLFLGAFFDMGVPVSIVDKGLRSMGLNEFNLDISKRQIKNIHESGVELVLPATDVNVLLHNKENVWIHPYSGDYRNYGEIKEMISGSLINEGAKSLARKIFDIKANAEALVHNVSIDQVRFHEAGAVDSIVDVVGVAICIDFLKINYVYSTAVPTGYGTIRCACGELPVPAPAVKAIIDEAGLDHYRSDIEQELMTPTGASILAGIVDEFVSDVFIYDKIKKIKEENQKFRVGRGVGDRETGLPPLCITYTKKDETMIDTIPHECELVKGA